MNCNGVSKFSAMLDYSYSAFTECTNQQCITMAQTLINDSVTTYNQYRQSCAILGGHVKRRSALNKKSLALLNQKDWS